MTTGDPEDIVAEILGILSEAERERVRVVGKLLSCKRDHSGTMMDGYEELVGRFGDVVVRWGQHQRGSVSLYEIQVVLDGKKQDKRIADHNLNIVPGPWWRTIRTKTIPAMRDELDAALRKKSAEWERLRVEERQQERAEKALWEKRHGQDGER